MHLIKYILQHNFSKFIKLLVNDLLLYRYYFKSEKIITDTFLYTVTKMYQG